MPTKSLGEDPRPRIEGQESKARNRRTELGLEQDPIRMEALSNYPTIYSIHYLILSQPSCYHDLITISLDI